MLFHLQFSGFIVFFPVHIPSIAENFVVGITISVQQYHNQSTENQKKYGTVCTIFAKDGFFFVFLISSHPIINNTTVHRGNYYRLLYIYFPTLLG